MNDAKLGKTEGQTKEEQVARTCIKLVEKQFGEIIISYVLNCHKLDGTGAKEAVVRYNAIVGVVAALLAMNEIALVRKERDDT